MNKQYAQIIGSTELDDFDKAASSQNLPAQRETADNPIATLLDGLVGGLTERQARNIRSFGVAGGTGTIHNLLSKHIGDTPSAILGAIISSYIVKKFIKG